MVDNANRGMIGEGSATVVCGLGIASGFGLGVAPLVEGVKSGVNIFRSLSGVWGESHPWSALKGAWIPDRSLFTSRRQGPASSLALHLAKQAVEDAGWGEEELRDAALVVGTSRGNSAGWLDEWPDRRRIKLLSVPQSLHSELASCVSIELGIHGPYHVVSSGCASGIDAVGLAWMLMKSGVVKRALAIGLDLPLSPALLNTYFDSKMLSKEAGNDPFHPSADGMLIAEGGAALAMEMRPSHMADSMPVMLDYRANSDAYGPLGMPPSGEYMAQLLELSLKELDCYHAPVTLCPHASGTRGNALSEQAALLRAFSGRELPDFRLMKPWVGHAIGGSGILELASMLAFARDGMLPPNPLGLTAPLEGVSLSESIDRSGNRILLKSASSMGGHNAIVATGIGNFAY